MYSYQYTPKNIIIYTNKTLVTVKTQEPSNLDDYVTKAIQDLYKEEFSYFNCNWRQPLYYLTDYM